MIGANASGVLEAGDCASKNEEHVVPGKIQSLDLFNNLFY
jgi:hypothetical protein